MKVGDSVRLKSSGGFSFCKPGDIVTITHIKTDYIKAKVAGHLSLIFWYHEIEEISVNPLSQPNPYAFKVGDKVIVIESTDSLKDYDITVGEIHQVTKIIGNSDISGGVNLLGKGGINYCNFRFKLVSDSAPKVPKECSHDMKQYIGFTETYMYCTKCDRKEK